MPIERACSTVMDEVHALHASIIDGSNAISSHVGEQIKIWKAEVIVVLRENFPLLEHEQRLVNWKNIFQKRNFSREDFRFAIKEYLDLCKVAQHPANESFWKNQLAPIAPRKETGNDRQDKLFVSAQLLLVEWQKTIDLFRSKWEIEKIEELRAELIKKIEQFLRLVQQLQAQLEELGLDLGVLFDLAKGRLSEQDIQHFQRWAKYLAEDYGVRALCELLGKMRQIELGERIERLKFNSLKTIKLPDINSREEIIGIRLGRDLEYALPSETALLSDVGTETLFYLKYAESRLLCFDMQGIQEQQKPFDVEEERKVQEEKKRGPIVICLDTSGSMAGMPETIAKAVALYVSTKAREQNRSCYLINFSTTIDKIDLTNDFNMGSLINFLKMSFHGGTDVNPALNHALETMRRDDYHKSDLLIISDFVMSDLPEEMLREIDSQRLNENKFYSLAIGSCYMTQRLRNLFDHEWVFDPQTGHVHELIAFNHKLEEEMIMAD